MRFKALIGSVAVVILPFALIFWSVGDNSSARTFAGFLWESRESDIIGFESSSSSSFTTDWFSEGGYYEQYFGSGVIGILILILAIVAIVLSVTSSSKKSKSTPGMLLIGISIGLIILRLIELGDADSSFYSQSTGFFGIETTYVEIPFSGLLGLILGILDLNSK